MKDNPAKLLQKTKPSHISALVLNLQFGVTQAENASLIKYGFWHILYFARLAEEDPDYTMLALHTDVKTGKTAYDNSLSWIGIRILPDTSLADCPVVLTQYCGAITVSPTLRNFIPNWILHTQIEKGNWEYVHGNWPIVKDELQDIHVQLGGDPGLFERLSHYIETTENFKTLRYTAKKGVSRAYEYIKVDNSTETVRFREFIQTLIQNQASLPDFPNNFGAWNDYARSCLATRATYLVATGQKTVQEAAPLLWTGFDKSIPFDSHIRKIQIRQFTARIDPGCDIWACVSNFSRRNKDMIPVDIYMDPLFAASQASRMDCKGEEHMKAAKKIDMELGNGKRSYEALLSASYFSANKRGHLIEKSYEAALQLAQKYQWNQMLEFLMSNRF
jgi:hypothetical protein